MKLVKVINLSTGKETNRWTTDVLPETHWEPSMGKLDRWVRTDLLTDAEKAKVFSVRAAPIPSDSKSTESLLPADYVLVIEDMTQITRQEKMDKIRAERNKLLAASDHTQLADSPLNSVQKQAMRDYRQVLRDLPQAITDVDNVVYPVKPEVQ